MADLGNTVVNGKLAVTDKATVNGGTVVTDTTLKTINGTSLVGSGNITVATDISGKADKATTLAGYGITDAKIENGKITLGSDSITPLTSHLTVDSALSSTSTNPVQNKAINSALAGKANTFTVVNKNAALVIGTSTTIANVAGTDITLNLAANRKSGYGYTTAWVTVADTADMDGSDDIFSSTTSQFFQNKYIYNHFAIKYKEIGSSDWVSVSDGDDLGSILMWWDEDVILYLPASFTGMPENLYLTMTPEIEGGYWHSSKIPYKTSYDHYCWITFAIIEDVYGDYSQNTALLEVLTEDAGELNPNLTAGYNIGWIMGTPYYVPYASSSSEGLLTTSDYKRLSYYKNSNIYTYDMSIDISSVTSSNPFYGGVYICRLPIVDKIYAANLTVNFGAGAEAFLTTINANITVGLDYTTSYIYENSNENYIYNNSAFLKQSKLCLVKNSSTELAVILWSPAIGISYSALISYHLTTPCISEAYNNPSLISSLPSDSSYTIYSNPLNRGVSFVNTLLSTSNQGETALNALVYMGSTTTTSSTANLTLIGTIDGGDTGFLCYMYWRPYRYMSGVIVMTTNQLGSSSSGGTVGYAQRLTTRAANYHYYYSANMNYGLEGMTFIVQPGETLYVYAQAAQYIYYRTANIINAIYEDL